MKCPKCGSDQKAKLGMTCGGCQYEFVFNPKEWETYKLTDGKFASYIRAASQNDTAYFTENQLYGVYCRRQSKQVWPFAVAGVILLIATFFLFVYVHFVAGIIACFLGIASVATSFENQKINRNTRRSSFQCLLESWNKAGNSLEWMITEPALHEPPPDWSEPDIYDYGVERILIVERDLLVDLFVKNGVHAEQRMLVIAESGYPNYLLPIARRLLNERPDLPVFLLHDATTQGAGMHARLLEDGPLDLSRHPVTDLGLFPADFVRLKRTSKFDPENDNRDLPVDALAMPALTSCIGAAMIHEEPVAVILNENERRERDEDHHGFG